MRTPARRRRAGWVRGCDPAGNRSIPGGRGKGLTLQRPPRSPLPPAIATPGDNRGRISDNRRFGAVDNHGLLRCQTGKRQRHRQAVVAVCIDRAALQPTHAMNDEPVLCLDRIAAQDVNLLAQRPNAVPFSSRRSSSAWLTTVSPRVSCGNGKGGELIDHAHHRFARDANAPQRRMPHAQVAEGLAMALTDCPHRNLCTHGLQHLNQSSACRVQTHFLDHDLRARCDERSNDEGTLLPKYRLAASASAAGSPGEWAVQAACGRRFFIANR